MGGVWEQVQTSLLGTLLSECREDLGAAPAWSELTLDFSGGAHRAPWTLFSSWSLPQFSDRAPLSCVSRGLPLHLLSTFLFPGLSGPPLSLRQISGHWHPCAQGSAVVWAAPGLDDGDGEPGGQ